MKKIFVSNAFQVLAEEDSFEVNGGIAPQVIGALIAAAVTIVSGAVAMDMQNATEQGKNDAYNDIKNRQNGSSNGVILL